MVTRKTQNKIIHGSASSKIADFCYTLNPSLIGLYHNIILNSSVSFVERQLIQI